MKNAYKLGVFAYLGLAVLSQGCSSDTTDNPATGGSSGHAGTGGVHNGGAGGTGGSHAGSGGSSAGSAGQANGGSGGATGGSGGATGGSGGATGGSGGATGGSGGATGGSGGKGGSGGATGGSGGATGGTGGATGGSGGATGGTGGATGGTGGSGGATGGTGGATGGTGGIGGLGGIGGIGGTGGTIDLTTGLLLNYTFDEGSTTSVTKIKDYSGNNNDGHPGSFQWVAGKVGTGALRTFFFRNAKSVDLPAGITTGITDFTIAIWIRPTFLRDWERVFDFGIDTSQYAHFSPQAGDNGGQPTFELKTAAGDDRVNPAANTKLVLNQWQHIAITQAGTTATMYINGVQVGQNTAMKGHLQDIATTNNHLGKSQYNDPGYEGDLDEFQMYGRALTAGEIGSLAGLDANTVASTNLSIHYKFDDGDGFTVADSSGNNKNATLHQDLTWQAGQVGAKSVLLDSTQGWVTMPANVFQNVTDFTMALWVNQTNAHNWAQLFDIGNDNTNYIALIPSNGDNQLIRVSIRNGGEQAFDGPALANNTWTHLAVTRKLNSVHLYVNGVSVAQSLVSNALPGDGSTINNWIGRSQWDDPLFDGSIDEARLYSRALTDVEVNALAGN